MNLDHLDDPRGFTPDDEFRAGAHRLGRRRRNRRRLVLATGSVLTSMAVLVAALAGYGLWRTSQIDRVDVEFAAPPVSLDEPFNVLLIGSDSRAGTADDDGTVTGARSDTMIVVRVVPAERMVELVSLPRDLVLDRSLGAAGRLNSVFAEGGPSALVAAVETQLGIPISGYADVDFRGFVDLVDAVGGLPVSVLVAARDPQTGLDIQPSDCTVLDGRTTLALVRSRHLETFGDAGRWVEDSSGDIGRMNRQRALIAMLVGRLGALSGSVGGLERSLDLVADHVTIDSRFSNATLLELARWLSGDGITVTSQVLPVTPVTIDRAAVLVLAAGADETVGELAGTLPPQADGLAEGKPYDGPGFVIPFFPCP